MRLIHVVLVLITSACSDAEPSNGERIAGAIETWWQVEERLQDGDSFSDRELECIAGRSGGVELDDLFEAADGDFATRTPVFLAPYADGCLTDEHLRSYFEADMIVSGIQPTEARCRAPGTVQAIREFGMEAVLAEDRRPEIEARFDALSDECES